MRRGPLAALLLGALLLAAPAHAVGLVLAYHRVDEAAVATYSPSAARLGQVVASLRALGYRFVTVSELAAALAATPTGAEVPQLAAITFDDGDASVARAAFPALHAAGVPATVFLISERLDRPGSLTRTEVRSLAAAGWEVGSHGASHAFLPDLTPASARGDLASALAALDELLGPAPRCLAYPYGGHDARVRAIAADAHACAFTTAPGAIDARSDPLALPRPRASVLDADGVAWRAERGLDPLALTVAAALTAGVWPGAAGASVASPPPGWQPAAWRALGDGSYEVAWTEGAIQERLGLRDGAWSLHAWRARALAPDAGSGAALAVARSLGDLTVAAAWVAGEGWGGGGALDLAGRGEAWAWWTHGGGWRLGVEALIADGVRLTAAWHALDERLAAELRAALPFLPGEGRPIALALGFDRALYARLTGRVGSQEAAIAVDTHGRVTASLRLRW